MRTYLLPESGNDYKANLHCHSTFSDGKMTVEELKQRYTENGYSIIAYTDHDVFIPHPELADDTFLPLHGFEVEINEPVEVSPVTGKRKTCHLCFIALDPETIQQPCWHRSRYQFGNAVNNRDKVQFDDSLPDYVREYSSEGISDMIRIGREKGFFVTYNHPTWSQESYPQYIGYKGMNAMEIVNSTCVTMGFDDRNGRVYDDLLRSGQRLYCIAADDTHGVKECFGGFTVIRAPKLEYRAVTDALMNGNFYCSEGPVIRDLWIEGDTVTVTVEGAREVTMTRGIRRAGAVRQTDEPVTEASFRIYPEDEYFRIVVTDAEGKCAYTNAYFVADLLEKREN